MHVAHAEAIIITSGYKTSSFRRRATEPAQTAIAGVDIHLARAMQGTPCCQPYSMLLLLHYRVLKPTADNG